jgi:NAD+ synthase (glutamine-hydrolysing)
MFGYYRVASAVNRTAIGNIDKNLTEILTLLNEAHQSQVAIVTFPELTLTGYSALDLFMNHHLIDEQLHALHTLLQESQSINTVAIIGMALLHQHRLYNTAVVIQSGKILGIVPKSYLPNKKEFYEKRHFTSGASIKESFVQIGGEMIPFGVDLLFSDHSEVTFGVEICEDLWAITPPSLQMASNGATLLFNLSASNELIGKQHYRHELVRTQSARTISAYIYSSAGVGESSTDTVYGGDALIAEYGSIVAQNQRFALHSHFITADIDLQKLSSLRLNETSYNDSPKTPTRTVSLSALPQIETIKRSINPHPFVPSNTTRRKERSEEILQIQAHGLIKRLTHAHLKKCVIGISGGLDSTLALLATHRAYAMMGWRSEDIIAITMPGFGTTKRTKSNATLLCEALGVELREINITPLALQEFSAIGHDPTDHNVTYENVQARIRTSVLMNTANKEGGLVIGTGDLSEIALGWSTYNGDHMSMYALNSSIPKTLIKYLIDYFKHNPTLAPIIDDILATPISPELLPHKEGRIVQETEQIIGAYELHDFFLYHFIKYGAKPSKIYHLASLAFGDKYPHDEIKKTLTLFLKRFFTQQFKRSCMPDGPKVGSISLSPRADWKMASDVDFTSWIEELQPL